MSAAAVDNVKRYGRQTREAQRAGRRRRHVDHPAANERPTVIDPHHHRAAVAAVGDLHLGAKLIFYSADS
jgi:hypothetical protein